MRILKNAEHLLDRGNIPHTTWDNVEPSDWVSLHEASLDAISGMSCNGFVEGDADPAFPVPTAFSDARGNPQADDVHYVDVTGLAADTTY